MAKKVMIRSFKVLRDKAFDKYADKAKEAYKKRNPDYSEQELDHNKYPFMTRNISSEMWEEFINDYINDVLLKDKELISIKLTYSESGGFFHSSEGYVAIIYDDKK